MTMKLSFEIIFIGDMRTTKDLISKLRSMELLKNQVYSCFTQWMQQRNDFWEIVREFHQNSASCT